MADNLHKFSGRLILLFGEVPTETSMRRIKAIFAKTSSQRRAVLDVIAALGKAPILDESRGE